MVQASIALGNRQREKIEEELTKHFCSLPVSHASMWNMYRPNRSRYPVQVPDKTQWAPERLLKQLKARREAKHAERPGPQATPAAFTREMPAAPLRQIPKATPAAYTRQVPQATPVTGTRQTVLPAPATGSSPSMLASRLSASMRVALNTGVSGSTDGGVQATPWVASRQPTPCKQQQTPEGTMNTMQAAGNTSRCYEAGNAKWYYVASTTSRCCERISWASVKRIPSV